MRTDDGGWDSYDGFVVRAETDHAARELLIKAHASDKHFNSWTPNHDDVIATELTAEGNEQIILGSFNAG